MYGERMPYIHRHVVCVCVCVSEQKGKPILFHRWGLGDRTAIHSQRHGVCVCMAKMKTILFHRGGGGGGAGPPSSARTVGKPTKPRRWGKGMPQKQRDILFHGGGGRGEYTMTSITH